VTGYGSFKEVVFRANILPRDLQTFQNSSFGFFRGLCERCFLGFLRGR